MNAMRNDISASQLHGLLNTPATRFAGTVSVDGNLPASAVRFSGKIKHQPDSKPNPLSRLIAKFTIKLPKFITWIMKQLNRFGLFKKDVTTADKTVEELLAQARPEKVEYAKFERPSTKIAKAKHKLTKDDPLVKKYGKGEYMHILETSGINWDETKIARDAIQNFYDGQGQTLDDTEIEVKKQGDKHRIKISASATYDPDKLLGVGGTGKRGSQEEIDTNTGGFGAGAKDVALCLLRDHGAEKVIHRSGEWQLEYYLADPGPEHTKDRGVRGLHAKLTLLDKPVEGNELEFTTNNSDLADKIKNGKSLYYHSGNPDFQNPTYENETGGFKLIAEDQEAHFYHAGQRREVGFHQGWKAIPGLHIWTNKKLLEEPSRDRGSYSEYQVEAALKEIISGMSAEETGQAIQVMMEDWFVQDGGNSMVGSMFGLGSGNEAASNREMLLEKLCEHLGSLTGKGKQNMPFELPKGLFTIGGMADESVVAELKERGYIPVKRAFGHLGVMSMNSLVQQLNINNEGLSSTEPTAQDKARIDLLKNQVIRNIYDQLGNISTFRMAEFERALAYEWQLSDGDTASRYRDPVLSADRVNHVMNAKTEWLREDDFTDALIQLVFNSDLFLYTDDDKQKTVNWLLNNQDKVAEWKKAWTEAQSQTVATA